MRAPKPAPATEAFLAQAVRDFDDPGLRRRDTAERVASFFFGIFGVAFPGVFHVQFQLLHLNIEAESALEQIYQI